MPDNHSGTPTDDSNFFQKYFIEYFILFLFILSLPLIFPEATLSSQRPTNKHFEGKIRGKNACFRFSLLVCQSSLSLVFIFTLFPGFTFKISRFLSFSQEFSSALLSDFWECSMLCLFYDSQPFPALNMNLLSGYSMILTPTFNFLSMVCSDS